MYFNTSCMKDINANSLLILFLCLQLETNIMNNMIKMVPLVILLSAYEQKFKTSTLLSFCLPFEYLFITPAILMCSNYLPNCKIH